MLIGLVYFLIWSPFLWVENISVESLTSTISNNISSKITKIAQNNLAKKIWGNIPQKSIILSPNNKIKEDILAQFPEIKEVVIYRQISQASLRIIIEERESIGIWCCIKEVEKDAEEKKELKSKQQNTTRRSGKNEDKAMEIFKEAGLIFTQTMDQGAKKAIELLK